MSTAEVKKLPLSQKREIFAALWKELAPIDGGAQTTEFERRFLDQRIDALESGRSRVRNWEDVKDQIGKR